jgi:hypothetical protein
LASHVEQNEENQDSSSFDGEGKSSKKIKFDLSKVFLRYLIVKIVTNSLIIDILRIRRIAQNVAINYIIIRQRLLPVDLHQ